MNKFGSFFKPLMWFMALLLATFVAGCGDDDDAVAPPAALTGVCAGASCVPLGTAGNFVILAEDGITDVGTTAVTGDVGNISTGGATIVGLTCAEVNGTVFDNDGLYAGGGDPDVSCRATDVARLNQAQTDAGAASTNAAGRTPTGTDPNPAAPIGPGVYNFTGGSVAISTDVTLSGNATDVWIFQITGNLDTTAATNILLTGGAKAKNVFWQVGGATTLGGTSTFEGVILSTGAITVGNGTTVNGRLITGAATTLDTDTVAQPTP